MHYKKESYELKKIQNFTILKISSERIRNNKYNLDVSYREAIRNQEIVHISDSQLIRTIHQITNSKYNQKNYNGLVSLNTAFLGAILKPTTPEPIKGS